MPAVAPTVPRSTTELSRDGAENLSAAYKPIAGEAELGAAVPVALRRGSRSGRRQRPNRRRSRPATSGGEPEASSDRSSPRRR